jgi:hypothetical protein
VSFPVLMKLLGHTDPEMTMRYVDVETDWAGDCEQIILPQCPVCEHGSIVGHGRRRKQAHDEYHDWIEIRRGRCPGCGRTFTFLPLFSFPYTHYSLLARCQALRRRFVENCSWEEALPNLKDSNRLPDPSTLRRWSSGLDVSQSLTDLQREFHQARAHPKYLVPQPKASSIPPRRGLDGVIDSLLASQHVLEMFRRPLPKGTSRSCLDRLSNRLTKILTEVRKLRTT